MPVQLTIEQFARAIKMRDPRLANVPDADLVRGVLERKPEMISMIQTSSPRPTLGMLQNIAAMNFTPQMKQALLNILFNAKEDVSVGSREALKQTFSALLENKSAEHRAQNYSPYPIEEYGYRPLAPAPPQEWWQQLPGAKRGE